MVVEQRHVSTKMNLFLEVWLAQRSDHARRESRVWVLMVRYR